MNLNYKYAILGFCLDLTDPNALSQPVGIIGIGELSKDKGFAMSISLFSGAEEMEEFKDDSYSRIILKDFQSFLHEQLNIGLKEVKNDDFLFWLQDRLRNTLHVSSIEQREVEMKDDSDVSTQIIADFIDVFKSVLGISEEYDIVVSGDNEPMLPHVNFEPLINMSNPDHQNVAYG